MTDEHLQNKAIAIYRCTSYNFDSLKCSIRKPAPSDHGLLEAQTHFIHARYKMLKYQHVHALHTAIEARIAHVTGLDNSYFSWWDGIKVPDHDEIITQTVDVHA